MNIKWAELKPVKTGMLRYMATDGSVHDCADWAWNQVIDVDEGAVVIARGPEEWLEFVKGRRSIENAWSFRHAVTIEDFKFLAACGISYGEPCGMESNAPAWMSEPLNMYSNRGDD